VPTHSVTIPHRYNGPLDSGQGGYSAGVVASFVDGLAAVNLRRPVPLDRALRVVREDGAVKLLDGEDLIADGEPVDALGVEVPEPVGVEDAHEATTRYPGTRDGPFSRCFVCGLARDDSLHVFAGEVPGRGVMATPWTPPAWTADDAGVVRPEFVWAVLDCPATFAPILAGPATAGFLARFSVRIDHPVVAGVEHVIIGWPLRIEGRKYHAGAAIFDADGTTLASAQALLIAPRDPSH
jgi:hypothetical protein